MDGAGRRNNLSGRTYTCSMLRTIFVALFCVNIVLGQDATAPAPAATTTTAAAPGPTRTSGANATTTTAQGPVAFAPTGAVDRASAPNPAASARLRTGNYALDSLASTPTSYNQIQVCRLYASTKMACKLFLTLSFTENICMGKDAPNDKSPVCLFRASYFPYCSPFYLLIL